MSGRKSSRRTLWVAVCLGSVLAAGVLPVASAGAAPAPAPPELVKGKALPYRVAFLPEPSPAPIHSAGVDVTEAGTLLARSIGKRPPAEDRPTPDGTGVYVTSRRGGAKALSTETDCGEAAVPTDWKPRAMNRDGQVWAEVTCMSIRPQDGGYQVAHWGALTARPGGVAWGSPYGSYPHAIEANDEGTLLIVHQKFVVNPRGATYTIGGGAQARKLVSKYDDIDWVYGSDLAEEGTVVGGVIRWWPEGPQEHYPFVAEGGSPKVTPLNLPPGVSYPYEGEGTQIKLKISPDADWILAKSGNHLISWDAARKPSVLSSNEPADVLDITDGGRALMWSSSGPAILKGKTLSPLRITGLPTGASLRGVTRMNAAGQISATVTLANGRARAVLLEPVR